MTSLGISKATKLWKVNKDKKQGSSLDVETQSLACLSLLYNTNVLLCRARTQQESHVCIGFYSSYINSPI